MLILNIFFIFVSFYLILDLIIYIFVLKHSQNIFIVIIIVYLIFQSIFYIHFNLKIIFLFQILNQIGNHVDLQIL